MIEVDAQVIEVISASQYRIRPQRSNACGGCSSQSGCSSGAFIKIFPVPDRPLLIDSETPLSIGQRIVIGLDERVVQRFALVTYLLPLVGLLLGSMLGDFLALQWNITDDETPAILGGLTGMATSFYLVKIVINKLMQGKHSRIVLLDATSSRISIDSLRT